MEAFEEILEFVLDGGRAAGLPEERLWKVRLALEELIVNVIRHAYPPTQPGTVAVGYRHDSQGAFCVQIRDRGVAFDPLSREAPDLSLGAGERPLGGLGIFLVRKLADEVDYRRAGNANVISFRL